MSVLVSVHNLVKSFGHTVLFKGLSFGLNEKEKLGLIGTNGSGKSTLLKLLANLEEPDSGDIIKRSGIKLLYLAQTDHFDLSLTVEEALLKSLANSDLSAVDRQVLADKALNLAGFTQAKAPIKNLSGGWKKRLAIARSLVQKPDLLLLDEPTNHLDIESRLWLENLLNKENFAFIIISHDRYFLENVCQGTMELSAQYPDGFLKIQKTYQKFLEAKDEFLEIQKNTELALKNKMKRETEWLERGPKARTTKAKSRIQEAEKLEKELLQIKNRNRSQKSLDFEFEHSQSESKLLMKVFQISKSYDDQKIIQNLSFTLHPQKRIGLLGRNGCGKSTLLKMIQGNLKPDQGSIKKSYGIKVLYFDQDRNQLDERDTLKLALQPNGSDTVMYQGKPVHVITWAQRFLFDPSQIHSPLTSFSGGEKARILLARLLLQSADILLMDEPTNDLDMMALDVLEKAMIEFPGAIIFATHDRKLMENVATDILAFEEDANLVNYASLDQWLLKQKEKQKLEKKTLAAKSVTKDKPKKTKKLTYKDQYELDHIEDKILKAEEEVLALEAKTQLPEVVSDPEKLTSLCEALTNAQATAESLYKRWQELEQKKENL